MMQDAPHTLTPQIEISCKIDSSLLGLLRDIVTAIARHLGFSEQEASEIEICVDEACANALEHAYKQSATTNTAERAKELSIEILYRNNALQVRVSDRGQGSGQIQACFSNIQEYASPERSEYRGLGIYLMQRFMDEVRIHSEPGKGTTVEMIKIRK